MYKYGRHHCLAVTSRTSNTYRRFISLPCLSNRLQSDFSDAYLKQMLIAICHVQFNSLNNLSHIVEIGDGLSCRQTSIWSSPSEVNTGFREIRVAENVLKRCLEAALRSWSINVFFFFAFFCVCLVWCLCPTLLMAINQFSFNGRTAHDMLHVLSIMRVTFSDVFHLKYKMFKPNTAICP